MGNSGNMQGERKEASPAAKARPKLNGEKSILLSDSCSSLSAHFNVRHRPLESVPTEGGVRFHPWTIICQRNQRVTLQRNRLKTSCIRLPIDVDLPASWIRQLTGVAQLLKTIPPNVQEVSQGKGTSTRSLDVYHAITGVRVEPIEARRVIERGRNTDIGGDEHWLPINIDGHMGVV